LLLQGRIGDVEHGSERQPRFRYAARCREQQRMNLVLGVELVDFFVDWVVGRMLDDELGRIGRGMRLTKGRVIDLRWSDIVDRFGCRRFEFAGLRFASHLGSSGQIVGALDSVKAIEVRPAIDRWRR
jgi:hypothetical protein